MCFANESRTIIESLKHEAKLKKSVVSLSTYISIKNNYFILMITKPNIYIYNEGFLTIKMFEGPKPKEKRVILFASLWMSKSD